MYAIFSKVLLLITHVISLSCKVCSVSCACPAIAGWARVELNQNIAGWPISVIVKLLRRRAVGKHYAFCFLCDSFILYLKWVKLKILGALGKWMHSFWGAFGKKEKFCIVTRQLLQALVLENIDWFVLSLGTDNCWVPRQPFSSVFSRQSIAALIFWQRRTISLFQLCLLLHQHYQWNIHPSVSIKCSAGW